MGLTAYPGKLVGGKVWFNGHEIENMKEKDFRKIRGNEVSIIMFNCHFIQRSFHH